MEYSSFYGGRRGASFVIAKSFKTIAEMVAAFSQGGNYKTVNYDEYVLIDTDNKNNVDNGKIFRRGLTYTDSMGGAVYIGQIVGPSGLSPHLKMTTVDTIKNMQAEPGTNYIKDIQNYTVGNASIVPGKDGNTFNDNITYAYISIRDDLSRETTVYIGFKFPYHVIDFTANSVSAYTTGELASRIDDKGHPFYEKWNIKIPKGIKGDTFKNLRVMSATTNIENYQGQTDDVNNSREVLVYDYYNYDVDPNPAPTTIFLGDYNMIDNITVTADGTLTIDYSHDDDSVFDRIFKWVDNISLNPNNGHFTVVYNQATDASGNPTQYDIDLNWLKDLQFDNNGTITWKYTHDPDRVYENFIKWVKSISLNENNGHFAIEFNYPNNPDGSPTLYEKDLNWVKDITFDDEGTTTLIYTYDNDKVYTKLFKWIDTVSLDKENGDFKVTFNHIIDKDGNPTEYINSLTWLKDIVPEADGTFTWKYTNLPDKKYANFLRWIDEIELDKETGHFKITFNYKVDENGNPTEYENDLTWVKDILLDEDGTLTWKYTDQPDKVKQYFFKHITDISIDKETGAFEVTYNTKDTNGDFEKYTNSLTWLKDIVPEADGTFTWKYTDQPDKTYPNFLRWIDTIELDEETGHFKITFNYKTDENGNPTDYENDLTWVKDIVVDNQGTMTFKYTNKSDKEYENLLRWIKTVELDKETGHLDILFNTQLGTDPTTVKYENDLTWVKDIILDDDGTLTWKYTDQPDETKAQLLKWITDVSLDENTGDFSITFNNTDTNGDPIEYTNSLTWIKDILLDPDGTVTWKYTNKQDKIYDLLFKWIDSLTLDKETGHFEVTYNHTTDAAGNSTIYENDLTWVKDIIVDKYGTITTKYTNLPNNVQKNAIKWIDSVSLDGHGNFIVTYNQLDTNGDPIEYQSQIKWINDAELSQNGSLTFNYCDRSTPITLSQKIQWIDDVIVNTESNSGGEGSGSQKVEVTYNTGIKKEIGSPINYVAKTAVTDDYHLLFWWSDPARRNNAVAAGKSKTWDGITDWEDMGSIKDDGGIYIGKNFDTDNYTNMVETQDAIDTLNLMYPSGLNDPDMIGKIVTTGTFGKNKKMYAFDYSTGTVTSDGYEGWYFLGTTADDTSPQVIAGPDNTATAEKASKLPEGSLWFVISEE